LWLKRSHRIKDTTIKAKIKRIKHLNKFVNLWDIETVTDYIQDADWSNGYKELMEYAYSDWCEHKGFSFSPHSYPKTRKLPYVPTETEIDQIISASSNKYA
jgi:hypothetical protein